VLTGFGAIAFLPQARPRSLLNSEATEEEQHVVCKRPSAQLTPAGMTRTSSFPKAFENLDTRHIYDLRLTEMKGKQKRKVSLRIMKTSSARCSIKITFSGLPY